MGRFVAQTDKGSIYVLDTLAGNKIGARSYLEARDLIQDLVSACFAVSSKRERDEFVLKHPTIECGEKLPGALSTV